MLVDLFTPEQVQWIRQHHERYDGHGYPDQLAGTHITEGARLVAVADAWDAMTVARSYGPPLTTTDALNQIRTLTGQQFCPDAASHLLTLHQQDQLAAASSAPN